jgi:hypothetical protein
MNNFRTQQFFAAVRKLSEADVSLCYYKGPLK